MELTRSQKFIRDNKRVLGCGMDYYNPDTSYMPFEDWDKKRLHFLLIFPTPSAVKAVSSTAAAILDYTITHCPDVYIDFAYVPDATDMKLYDKNDMPYAIGLNSHLDASHFELVGFSISVLCEVIGMATIMNSFSRCDKPIPLTWTERKDAILGTYPVIYCGGITAACGDIMYGPLGDGRQAFPDFTYLGDCCKLNVISNRFLQAIDNGEVIRTKEDREYNGSKHYPAKFEATFTEKFKVITHQDFINCLLDMMWIYHPQGYEVKFNDKTQIISNKKINKYCQPYVTPCYPHVMEEDLGIGRTIIPASGDNAGVSQTQVSEGCSASGACSFCSEGNYCLPKGTLVKSTEGLMPIDELKVGDKVVLLDKQLSVLDTVVVGEKPTITFELSNHQKIKVANTHLILTIENGHVLYKRAFNLKDGDFIAYERSESFGSNKTDKAYLVGAVIGDGHFYPEQNLVKVYSPNHEVEEMKLNLGWMSCSRHSNSIMRFSKQTKELTKELLDLGLTHETSVSKRIPKFFFNADKETVSSLLRGMFDTDGTIKLDSKKRATVSYSTVSEKLRDDLVALLSMFGIRATVYEDFSKAHYKSTGEWIKYSHGWEVTIFGNENIKRFKEIGFGLLSKQEKLEESVEAAFEVDYVPTFEKRVNDWYHQNKDFNRQVRKCNDSLRKVVNGWTNMHWLSKRHFQKSFDFLSEDLKKDYAEASQYEFVQITSVEEGPEEMMYDINVEGDHAYSLCGWVSHNTGGWVEKTKCQILKEIWESKKYSAAWKYKPFSFNSNYLTDYKGMLAEFLKVYPKVTFLNMRMEELGRDLDAIKMMKLVGNNRMSAPMEGISPRIQNNMLNKCLSELSLFNFMDDMVHMRLTDIKVGAIFTAYEEDEDFQWICDFVDKFKARAAEENGNFPFRLKACATKDAITPIEGVGLVRQDELMPNLRVHGYRVKTIIASQPQGVSNVVRITLSNGVELKVTPNHKVLTTFWPKKELKESWYTEAKELVPGQRVFCKMNTQAFGDYQKLGNVTIDEKVGKLLGWYMGDGWASNGYQVGKWRFGCCFNADEIDIYHELWEIAESIGFSVKDFPYQDDVKHIRMWRAYNKELCQLIIDEFNHGAHGKKVSSLILKSPKSVQVQFLRYWFTADGTVVSYKNSKKYNSRVSLCSVNKQVLLDCQAMLLNLGILSNVRGFQTKCQTGQFYTYQLEIRSCSVSDFKDVVGFEGVKQDKIFIGNRRGSHCLKSGGVFTVTVKSVEEVLDEETFGIEVEGHSYLTYGVMSHNTPLVHYNLTPCEYLERKSAKKSMLGEHWLTDEWYEKFREHNVFFKVNGFRYSTFIEQSLIDLGRLATPLVYKEIIQNNIGVYSLRSVATDGFVQGLKDLINPDYFFNDRDPEHYISLSHRIHIELLGSYVPRARRLVRLHQQGKLFENEPDIRCLKTYEGAKTKCQKFCIKKDPLKIYDDVEMDEEGNLHGEYEELYGCQRCNSNEERAGRLNRKIVCTKNSDDIIAVKRKPKVQKLRFVLKRNPEFEVLNPNNTAYTFITKFLQLSDNLLHEYHSMNVHSMFWESDPDEKYQVSGLQIVEVIWSNYVYDEVVSLIPEVNKMLKSTQVLSVKRIMMEEKIKLTDYNVCRFESSLPYEMFQNAIHTYKGEIKVKKDIAFEVVQDPTLKKPVIQQLGKVVGYFICPARYSPFYYLQGFLGVKKVSETKLAQSTDIQCMMVVRESKNTVCKNCGKESGTISLTTDKNFPFGVNCLTKALMSAEVKRMKEKN